MSKRLVFLEKLVADGSTDPMAWYGLAMEYRSTERFDDALRTFQTLRSRDPGYVAMYLMCGEMLAKGGDLASAREWYTAGVLVARSRGDGHALGELEAALGLLE